jgi:hypothetical protein
MEVSGVKSVDVDEQQLDLAALVASQAQRKNPNYAPIHNTAGMIQVELVVQGYGRTFGRFLLTPTPGRPVQLPVL